MRHDYAPETHCWLLGNILVTAVAEGGETAITMTCTTTTPIDTVRQAMATLATLLQQAAQEQRAVTA